jgi:L-ascorbate metabolism protein UlaG (beta-lactamase superfamily)
MKLSRRRMLALLPGAGLVVGGGAYVHANQSPVYAGKVTDHFDGLRFFDPKLISKRGPLDFWRWQLTRDQGEWPEQAPSPFADKPPRRVEGGNLRVSFVGHASFLIQAGGVNILLDPVWSERASPVSFAGPKRVNVPGIAFDALPPIDVALVSHGHYDHLDTATLSALATPHRTRVIAPLGNDIPVLEANSSIAIEAHDWGSEIQIAPGVKVTLAPMRHWTARGLTDRNKALWASFVIETPAGRIYHVGDSGYGDGFYFRAARDQYGPFKLALLPIGAYSPRWFMNENHMDPAESVRAFRDSGAEYAIAHHFGTFRMADDPFDEPPQLLAAALKEAAIPAERFRTLKPGEVWEL